MTENQKPLGKLEGVDLRSVWPDEVMCGMGRTGALFAGDVDGVTPDILAIA